MVTVREAVADDAAALARVHVAAWQAAYRGLVADEALDQLSVADRERSWADALSAGPQPGSARLVATIDDEVVGFIVVGPASDDPSVGEVHALNVAPEVWGQEIGQALLAEGVDRLIHAGFTEAVLWVHPGNTRARRFYEHAGWVDDHARREEQVFGITFEEERYRRTLPDTDAAPDLSGPSHPWDEVDEA